MEIERKGFVYTLEAVMAASLMMGVVVFVVPEIQQVGPPSMEDLDTALGSLDQSGELGENITELEDQLLDYSPSNYNLTVRLETVRTRDRSVTGGDSIRLENGTKELMIWKPEGDISASYKGVTVFDRNSGGYHRVGLGDRSGYLNFSGSSDADIRVNYYQSEGNLPVTDVAYTTNFIDYSEKLREVQVIVWR